MQVSPEDLPLLEGYSWVLNKSLGYWVGRRRGGLGRKEPMIYLHRHLMGAKRGQIVDHINGDKQDNRRENLRFVTKGLNNANKGKRNQITHSRYKGVSFVRRKERLRKPWVAYLNGSYLGYFETEEEAAQAYNLAALLVYGPQFHFNEVSCS